MSRPSARLIGLACAILVLAVDQAFEAWMLYGFRIGDRGAVALMPIFDLRLAWNTGISYSLFRAEGVWGRLILASLALLASLVLGFWLSRSDRRPAAIGLGFIIGGALGNAWDRLAHGAVADFFHIHWAGFSPFGVFNLADIAIVAGVAFLLYDGLFIGMREAGTERR